MVTFEGNEYIEGEFQEMTDKVLLLDVYLVLRISSVQFSHSVVSNCLQSHGLQHARLPLSITNSQSLLKLTSIESVADYKPGKETSPETIPVDTSISDFQPPEKLRK